MKKDSGFWARTSLNTFTNIVRTILMAVIGILLVPYYVDSLGMASYGIIPLATTMTSYISILTDSLLTAYSRHATIAIEREENASRILNTIIFGITRLCLMIVPVALVVSLASPFIFDVADNSFADVALMFFMIIVSSLIFTVGSAFDSVFYAFNKTYIIYASRIVYTLSQVGFIVLFFVISGPSLVWIGVAYLGSSILLAIISIYLAKRLYPSFRITAKEFSLTDFKNMSTVGVWNVVQKVGKMLYIQASLVLVNLYLGSEAGAEFAIVSSLISMVHTACYSITTSVDPLIYACYADQDIEKLNSIMKTGMRVTGLMMAMPIAFIMVFPTEILLTWIGPECGHLGNLARIAFVGEVAFCAIDILGAVPVAFLKINTLSFWTVIIGIVNIVSTVLALTIFDLGNEGAIWVWMLSTLALSAFTVLFNERITSVRPFGFVKEVVIGYIGLALSILVLYGISQFIEVRTSWLFLIPFAAICYIIYLIVVWYAMGRKTRGMLLTAIPSSISSKIPKFMR